MMVALAARDVNGVLEVTCFVDLPELGAESTPDLAVAAVIVTNGGMIGRPSEITSSGVVRPVRPSFVSPSAFPFASPSGSSYLVLVGKEVALFETVREAESLPSASPRGRRGEEAALAGGKPETSTRSGRGGVLLGDGFGVAELGDGGPLRGEFLFGLTGVKKWSGIVPGDFRGEIGGERFVVSGTKVTSFSSLPSPGTLLLAVPMTLGFGDRPLVLAERISLASPLETREIFQFSKFELNILIRIRKIYNSAIQKSGNENTQKII
jgi:hypothetical protein